LRKTGSYLKKIKDTNSGSNKLFRIIRNNWAAIIILNTKEMDSEEIITWEMCFDFRLIK
jgi:hypothetical protein